MKHWKGWWLMVVAALHTIYAMIRFHEPILMMVENGLINTAKQAEAGQATWFLLFGFALFAIGLLVREFEQAVSTTPKSAGIVILLISVVGIILLPLSGFWLVLPVPIAIITTREHKQSCSR